MSKLTKTVLLTVTIIFETLALLLLIGVPDKGTKIFIAILMGIPIFIFLVVKVIYSVKQTDNTEIIESDNSLKGAFHELNNDLKKGSKKLVDSYNELPSVKTQNETKKRIAENKANAIACCPKCGSTSLSANKKGFGIGKAVIGAYATGGIGLVAGNIGAKKVRVTCLNCGHQFMAGKQ